MMPAPVDELSEARIRIEELEQTIAAMQKERHQFRQILDAIDDFVLVKGEKSRIIWGNRAFRDYYGMTEEQLQGIIDAPHAEPDYTQQYVIDDAKVFNSGQPLNIASEPVKKHDGSVR